MLNSFRLKAVSSDVVPATMKKKVAINKPKAEGADEKEGAAAEEGETAGLGRGQR